MSLFHTNTLLGASGSGSDPIYAEDVFSTFLYDGSESAQTITNGIDLSGEGGLVWMKQRSAGVQDHALMSSEVGDNDFGGWLSTNDDGAVTVPDSQYITANSDGFRINNGGVFFNDGTEDYVSWTFRKCPGFFDVVTWTGNGSNRTISHSLGSTPGFIIIKRISASEDWTCWHRSVGATKYLQLNGNGSAASLSAFMNDTEPTSTNFTVGTHDRVNTNGETYVAYVFAHNDQSFGTDSDEAIISCGSLSGSIGNGGFVSLGFEPQWILAKRTDSSDNWYLADIMRDASINSGRYLRANTNNVEESAMMFEPTPTGFRQHFSGASAANIVYIAIRRPHKPPTAATEVFKAVTYAGSSSAQTITGAGFAPDWMWSKDYGAANNGWYHDRLRGEFSLDSSGSGAEQDRSSYVEPLGQDGIEFDQGGFDLNRNGSNHVAQFMRRAPGFFDIVTWTGNGANRTLNHNLEAVPELMIIKNTEDTNGWTVYHASRGNTKILKLNGEDAESTNANAFNSTTPTASVFSLGDFDKTNKNGDEFVGWLWASLSGICDIGQYSGSSSAVTVDCGFAAAPRYILIKAVNRSDPWYVFDHARGIVAGNDPYLQLDKTNAQTTGDDVIDPTSSGFTVNTGYGSGFNESGNTYIYFAIA